MTLQQQRKRRAARLCIYCVKQIAFKKSGRTELFRDEFWRAVDGNFLDMCVIEWCKLFADENNGRHYWKKVITDHNKFFSGLLNKLSCSEEEFTNYISEFKEYRDKFVAHLDDKTTGYYPKLDMAKESCFYLYDYLLTNEYDHTSFHDAPDIRDCFSQSLAEGNKIYSSIVSDA
jgi:hypothetical protein